MKCKVTFQSFGRKNKTHIFDYPDTCSDHDVFCWSEVWAIQHLKDGRKYEATKIERV